MMATAALIGVLSVVVGLVISFAARRPQMLARPSFEFDNNADAIFQ